MFADFSWDLLDDVTLDAGIRYNWESKYFNADIRRGGPPNRSDRSVSAQSHDGPEALFSHQHGRSPDRYPWIDLPLRRGARGLRQVHPRLERSSNSTCETRSVVGEVTDVANPEIIDAFEIGFAGGLARRRRSRSTARSSGTPIRTTRSSRSRTRRARRRPRSSSTPRTPSTSAPSSRRSSSPIDGLHGGRQASAGSRRNSSTSRRAARARSRTATTRIASSSTTTETRCRTRRASRSRAGLEYAIDLDRIGTHHPALRHLTGPTRSISTRPKVGDRPRLHSGNDLPAGPYDQPEALRAAQHEPFDTRNRASNLEVALWVAEPDERGLQDPWRSTLPQVPDSSATCWAIPRTYGVTLKLSY